MPTTLVASYTPGSNRNDFSGYVGMKFVATAFSVTTLGLRKATGNTGSHTVYLLNAANTVLASATIDLTSGSVGTFYYGAVTPVSLTNGVTYYLVTQVTSGGQNWADQNTVTLNSIGSAPQAIFSSSLGSFTPSSANQMYVGVDINGTVATTPVSTSKPAYLRGTEDFTGHIPDYIRGAESNVASKAEFIAARESLVTAKSAYSLALEGLASVKDLFLLGVEGGITNQVLAVMAKELLTGVVHQFVYALENLAISQALFLQGTTDESSAQAGFLAGQEDLLDSQGTYLLGYGASATAQGNYLTGIEQLSTSLATFLAAPGGNNDHQDLFLAAIEQLTTNQSAFILGLEQKIASQASYLLGQGSNAVDQAAYLGGLEHLVAANSSYLMMVDRFISSLSSYLAAPTTSAQTANQTEFLTAREALIASKASYVQGLDAVLAQLPIYFTKDSQALVLQLSLYLRLTDGLLTAQTSAFLLGNSTSNILVHQAAYLAGTGSVGSQPAFFNALAAVSNSIQQYLEQAFTTLGQQPGYTNGIEATLQIGSQSNFLTGLMFSNLQVSTTAYLRVLSVNGTIGLSFDRAQDAVLTDQNSGGLALSDSPAGNIILQ